MTDIEVLSGRYQTHGLPEGFERMNNWLPLTFMGVGVHGKFIYFLLTGEWSIWNTLGMTGAWSKDQQKHSRIKFILDDGEVFFNDVRNFGTLKAAKGKDPIIEKLKSLGPDVLSQPISDQEFKVRLSMGKSKPIGEVLLKQEIFAGIGNYLRAEALYEAKINPHRKCDSLSDSEISRINAAVTRTIKESYDSGGATLSDYSDLNGERGKFSDRFAVYGNDTDPEGNEIIKESVGGRTIHWVPNIQT